MANKSIPNIKKRPTIRDVAKASGVSYMTVSRVMNGSSTVKIEARKRVEMAVKKLDYQPNEMARSMRTSSTKTIGFMLPDITNTTNAAIAQAAETVLAEAGFRMILLSTGFESGREAEYLHKLPGNIVDGMIAAIVDEDDLDTQELIASCQAPVVVIDRDLPFPIDTVKSEHKTAMRSALRHLTSLGHKKIGIVMSPLSMRPGKVRVEAYRKFMEEAGIEIDDRLVKAVPQSPEEGRLATLRILGLRPRPTALLVGANQLTFGAMQAIQELGIKVPEELSVIGADDLLATGLFNPPLTVIWRDMAEVGRYAAKLLLERLSQKNSEPCEIILKSELILRASCDKPQTIE